MHQRPSSTEPPSRSTRPRRRADDTEEGPQWAIDLMREVSGISTRLSRIEGGLALAGVLAALVVALIAARVIVLHLS